MSRKVGQIIARGERRWLVRVYLGRDSEMRKRTYHNQTVYGSLRHAQAYLTKRLQCAVKGAGPQREINPPGNWIAPPGSNWSGGGGNKTAGASDVEGRTRRLGESAGRNVSER